MRPGFLLFLAKTTRIPLTKISFCVIMLCCLTGPEEAMAFSLLYDGYGIMHI